MLNDDCVSKRREEKGKEDKSLRLIDSSNATKTITKLIWIESMRIVLKNAFQIIGIEPLEKM